MSMLERSVVENALKKVIDPEIGMDIITMGLIYDIIISDSSVHIKMTLTSPMCPYGQFLIDQVKDELKSLDPKLEVKVEMVWDPPWSPPAEVKLMFGL